MGTNQKGSKQPKKHRVSKEENPDGGSASKGTTKAQRNQMPASKKGKAAKAQYSIDQKKFEKTVKLKPKPKGKV